MTKIYHNPRCSKSRQGLALLETLSSNFETVNYMKTGLKVKELQELLELLEIDPILLVRKNESIWKEHFKNQNLKDHEIIEAMVEHPKLIERPIVVHRGRAVIGRPTEEISSLF